MGTSKREYLEQSSRESDSGCQERLTVKKEELWQEYFIMMARKYFPNGCNICNVQKGIILTDSSIIYGSSYGLIYFCTNCKSYVGVHSVEHNPHGEKDAPKGTLADSELRRLRKNAHALFDPLWQKTNLSRRGAYKVLIRVTKVSQERAHIAMLTKSEITILIEYFKTLKVNKSNESKI